jgi:hypothetical protein
MLKRSVLKLSDTQACVVSMVGVPKAWSADRIKQFAARVVRCRLPRAAGSGALTPAQPADAGTSPSPSDVVTKLRFGIDASTGEFTKDRVKLWFADSVAAETFIGKLPRYLAVLKDTGGFELAGCGWLAPNVSAASQDARPYVYGARAYVVSGKRSAGAAEVLAVLHSYTGGGPQTGNAQAGFPEGSTAHAGISLLDMHLNASSIQERHRSGRPQPRQAGMVLTNALLSGNAADAMDDAVDRLSLDDVSLCPDTLWNVRKLHIARNVFGNHVPKGLKHQDLHGLGKALPDALDVYAPLAEDEETAGAMLVEDVPSPYSHVHMK